MVIFHDYKYSISWSFWLVLYTESLFSLEIGTETMFQTDLYQSSLSVYKVNNVAPAKG